ncbi:5-formyltetrahydrofolate cyclo-ligase [Desulfotomaculum sp. 1211_IL3151]|uniref:5-formyltetrahydrofolate cyclo-ligase n=1 Tax=Desulfotomaculum sp. 1211_IL3151 TaxID=3084055 RepID=UPI002FD8AE02
MEKNKIRKQVLEARSALVQAEVIEKSGQVIERLLGMNLYQGAGTIMVYLDFRNEVKTNSLIKHALGVGKRVVVPVANTVDRSMTPSQLVNYPSDLTRGSYGILEPAPDKVRPIDPWEIDFVIVPGAVFDHKGNRMGYGGGYYDRFIPRLKKGAVTVALAYELQVKQDFSNRMGQYDQPVQYIITEKRIIEC